jgi:molybdopterin converting factor small subunit
MSEDMCRVRVIFFGAIRGIIKRKDDFVVLPKDSATLSNLVQILSERYGRRLSGILTHDNNSSPLVTFFLNGRNIDTSEGDEKSILLDDGSEVEVSLVSQMTGG